MANLPNPHDLNTLDEDDRRLIGRLILHESTKAARAYGDARHTPQTRQAKRELVERLFRLQDLFPVNPATSDEDEEEY